MGKVISTTGTKNNVRLTLHLVTFVLSSGVSLFLKPSFHQRVSWEDMDKAVKEMDEKISRAEHWELDQMIGFENEGTKAGEKMKETRERLNKGRSGAKEAESQRAEQERKSREKQEREQKDRDNFERGGWY